MYGVPKYRESFFWKFKKEIFLAAAALVTVSAVGRFSPEGKLNSPFSRFEEKSISATQNKAFYKVLLNGKETGIVSGKEEADELAEKAYTSFKKKLGYDPEFRIKLNLEVLKKEEVIADPYEVLAKMELLFESMISDQKKKAYVVKVGEEFTVALPDEESAKEVLRRAQQNFLNSDLVVEVDLKTDQYNSLVTTPKLLVFNPENERTLVAGNAEAVDLSPSRNESIKTNPLKAVVHAVQQTLKQIKPTPVMPAEAQYIEADAPKKPAPSNEILVDVSLPKDVLIAENYVSPDKIVDIETATQMLMQNKVEEKVYLVETGDSPSLIAQKNQMPLSRLYQLNPSLKEGKAVIHVGDEVVVMAPEPLLKVIAKYETSYQEPILKTVVEEKDPNMYLGSSKTKYEGKDGVQNVKAIITKVNGEKVASEVLDTDVLVEMEPKIRLVGTKPLPPKATTGKFIYPLNRFVLSSGYGYRWGSFHAGIDLAAPRGTVIMASDGGTVTFAGWHRGGYGYMVKVLHSNGTETLYAHMSKITCKLGQRVAQGEKIGEVGSTGNSTGNHCHFEIHINGVRVNPAKYL